MQIDLLHDHHHTHTPPPTTKPIALFLLFRFFFFLLLLLLLLLLLQAILDLKFSSQKTTTATKTFHQQLTPKTKQKTNPPTKDVKPQNEEHLHLLLSNCRKSLGKMSSIYQSILLLLLLQLLLLLLLLAPN